MRRVAMRFSLLQFPRYGIHTLTNSWWKNLPKLSRRTGVTPSLKVLGSDNHGLQGRQYRRLSRQSLTTKEEVIIKDRLSSKSDIDNNLLDQTESTITYIYKPQVSAVGRTEIFGIRHLIAENKDLAKLATFLTFDIETTGLLRSGGDRGDRIIEVGLQDLSGGKNSTFETLVNPECYVPNSNIHGISTRMVNRPDVPRMHELIPIMLKYIESRRKPGGFIVLVAHNGRSFDFRFLIQEFTRCSYKIPEYFLFLDNLALARDAMKLKGLKEAPKSLQALVEFYQIPSDGSAHRALSDVKMLSLVFQRLTFDLRLHVHDLIAKYTFTEWDLENSKKKRKILARFKKIRLF